VHQDDVLGVDEPGGAGAGHHVAGQVGELTVRVGGPAVMTPRMPPGRSTRWQAAYSSPGSGQPSPPGCAAPELGARVRLLAAGDTNKNGPNDARSVAIAALRSAGVREVRAR
jgi:hypothetical protein